MSRLTSVAVVTASRPDSGNRCVGDGRLCRKEGIWVSAGDRVETDGSESLNAVVRTRAHRRVCYEMVILRIAGLIAADMAAVVVYATVLRLLADVIGIATPSWPVELLLAWLGCVVMSVLVLLPEFHWTKP